MWFLSIFLDTLNRTRIKSFRRCKNAVRLFSIIYFSSFHCLWSSACSTPFLRPCIQIDLCASTHWIPTLYDSSAKKEWWTFFSFLQHQSEIRTLFCVPVLLQRFSFSILRVNGLSLQISCKMLSCLHDRPDDINGMEFYPIYVQTHGFHHLWTRYQESVYESYKHTWKIKLLSIPPGNRPG